MSHLDVENLEDFLSAVDSERKGVASPLANWNLSSIESKGINGQSANSSLEAQQKPVHSSTTPRINPFANAGLGLFSGLGSAVVSPLTQSMNPGTIPSNLSNVKAEISFTTTESLSSPQTAPVSAQSSPVAGTENHLAPPPPVTRLSASPNSAQKRLAAFFLLMDNGESLPLIIVTQLQDGLNKAFCSAEEGVTFSSAPNVDPNAAKEEVAAKVLRYCVGQAVTEGHMTSEEAKMFHIPATPRVATAQPPPSSATNAVSPLASTTASALPASTAAATTASSTPAPSPAAPFHGSPVPFRPAPQAGGGSADLASAIASTFAQPPVPGQSQAAVQAHTPNPLQPPTSEPQVNSLANSGKRSAVDSPGSFERVSKSIKTEERTTAGAHFARNTGGPTPTPLVPTTVAAAGDGATAQEPLVADPSTFLAQMSPSLRGVLPTYTAAQQALISGAPVFSSRPFVPTAAVLPGGRTPLSTAVSPISRLMETCARMGLGVRPALECVQLPHGGWVCRDTFLGKSYESRFCYGRKQDAREDVAELVWIDIEAARVGSGGLADAVRARGINIPAAPLRVGEPIVGTAPNAAAPGGGTLAAPHLHPVSRLKEYSERRRMGHSFYLEESREGGAPRYRQRANVGNKDMPWSAWHGSKKAAKEEAARSALLELGVIQSGEVGGVDTVSREQKDAMTLESVKDWNKAMMALAKSIGRGGVIRRIAEEKVKGVEEQLGNEVAKADNRVKVVAANGWGRWVGLSKNNPVVLYLQAPPNPRLDSLRPTSHLLQVLRIAAEQFAASRSRRDAVQNIRSTHAGVTFFYYGQPFDVVLCAEVKRQDLERYMSEVLNPASTIPEWEKRAAVWDWSSWYAREGARWAARERMRERDTRENATTSGTQQVLNNNDVDWRTAAKLLKFMMMAYIWPVDKTLRDVEEMCDWVARGAWEESGLVPPVVASRRPFIGDAVNPFANWADGNDSEVWAAIASWARDWAQRLGKAGGVEVELGSADAKAEGGAGTMQVDSAAEVKVPVDGSEDDDEPDAIGTVVAMGTGVPATDSAVLRLFSPRCAEPVKIRLARFNVHFNIDPNAHELFPVYTLPAVPSAVLSECIRRGVPDCILAALALYTHCEVEKKNLKGDALLRTSATYLNSLRTVLFDEAEPGKTNLSTTPSSMAAGTVKYEVVAGSGRTLQVSMYIE
ncbi:hypothetical protein HDU93_004681 [Gonapodya sp. JEL0774]|nr:hypothetical protein HDU93_004681 [Gonapodya sp. JEL0774]